MENEFSRKHNFKNPEDCGLARHLGLPYQDERLYYSVWEIIVLIAFIIIGLYVAIRIWRNRHGGQW